MAGDFREIALNARRARFIADHWEDETGMPNLDVTFEVGVCMRKKIEDLMEKRPEFRTKLAVLHEEVMAKEFWKNLAENMEGTHFAVCGLDFKVFEYLSSLKPLWGLDGYEQRPVTPPPSAAFAPPPQAFPESTPRRPERKRKWGCHPVGCLGRMGKLIVKLLLPVWLVMYAVKLWSPPYGDAPKPEVEVTTVAGQKPATEAEAKKGSGVRDGTFAVGTRVVAKKVVPVYRLNTEKKPVVAGRVPPGGVLEVIGVVNAKVVRVSVELPNGKTAKGMAKVADLE